MQELKWVKVIEDPRPEYEDDEQRLVYATTDDRFVLSRGGAWDFVYPWQLYYVPTGERKRVAKQLAEGRLAVDVDWQVGLWYAKAKPPIKPVEFHIIKLFDKELDRIVEANV